MKRYLISVLILTGIISFTSGYSQQQGFITYEVKMQIRNNEEQDDEFITGEQQLFFNATGSLYAPVFDAEEESFDNGVMTFRQKPPQFLIYTNLSERKIIEQTEFLGKKYRVTDSLKVNSWKLGTGTRVILGHECKEATFNGDSLHPSLIVWYTNDLRSYLGPENFNTLPGAVLEVIVGNGRRVLTARNIEVRELEKNELAVPKRGKIITRYEYDKLVKEETEKMKRSGGGGMIGG